MWLIPPALSSACPAELACSIRPLSSCSETLELRVSLSGKAEPRPLSWRGWQTRPWAAHLFGAGTWEGSMPDSFAVWFVSSLRDCPASPTVPPGTAPARLTLEATGKTVRARSRKPSVSSPNVAPPWCSSRTSQPSFAAFEMLTEDSAIPSAILDRNYRDWVTKSLSLSSSLRETLERVTSGNGFSSWPTIRANEGSSGEWVNQRDGSTLPTLNGVAQNWETPTSKNAVKSKKAQEVHGSGPGLEQQAQTWPTPNANPAAPNNGKNRGDGQIRERLTSQCLEERAQKWTTPMAHDVSPRGKGQKPCSKAGNACLARDAETWATPKAKTGGANSKRESREGTGGPDLQEQAERLWKLPTERVSARPTPAARDHKGSDLETRNGGASLSHFAETGERWHTPTASDDGQKVIVTSQEGNTLLAQADRFSRRVLDQTSGQELSPPARTLRPRLNPAFACWLMGWPTWWTHPAPISFAASEMALWRSKLRSHLRSFLLALEGGSRE